MEAVLIPFFDKALLLSFGFGKTKIDLRKAIHLLKATLAAYPAIKDSETMEKMKLLLGQLYWLKSGSSTGDEHPALALWQSCSHPLRAAFLALFYFASNDMQAHEWNRLGLEYLPNAIKTCSNTLEKHWMLSILAKLYSDGDGVGIPIRPYKAYEALKLASEQQCAIAQSGLGYHVEIINGDFKEAVKWYRTAAEQGFCVAQRNLAICYRDGEGVPRDFKQAMHWLRLAAEQGYSPAQSCIGALYDWGDGVEVNHKEAVLWYKQAAEQGDGYGQYSLARCYLNGHGTEKNIGKAIHYFKLAASKGSPPALTTLGYCYELGEGVEKDVKEAVRYYSLAADKGNDVGVFNLGRCYKTGTGVSRDLEEAFRLYERAAQKDNETALYVLGHTYEHGTGVEKDLKEACRHYILSRANGKPNAQEAIERVET